MPAPRTSRAARPVRPWLLAAALGVVACVPAAAGEPAPEFARRLDDIPVYGGLGPEPNPWQGGWEKARPQLLDHDGDGDLDLFVAEEDGRLRQYRNDGSPGSPDFRFITDSFSGVHEYFFARFVNVDGDADWDLLVEAPRFTVEIDSIPVERSGAYLYTNTGTAGSPVWENLSSHPQGYLADDQGDAIPVELTSPDFVDLEGDGDPDLLLGDPTGSLILYRNVGTPGAPVFQFETDSYQDLVIVFGNCNPERPGPVTLGELLGGPDGRARHGFMLFNFHDVDGDSLQDLFIGDQFNPNVYYLQNLGGSPNPDFVCQTQDFFPAEGGGPGTFPQYLVSTFGDLDNDGDEDALLGSGIDSYTGLLFFRNDGRDGFPSMTLVDDDWLPELDYGKNSAPAFADLDGDLDLDLYSSFGTAQRIAFYENIGTAEAGEFAEISPSWRPMPNTSWSVPEFADLDADLDQDLFVGVTSGAVRWFRNDGGGTFAEVTDDPMFGDSPGKLIRAIADAQSVPRFLDTDVDGDLDLVMGFLDFQGAPTLLHFRNDGTPQVPSLVLATNDFQGLGSMGQNLAPAFGDLDDDDDADLLVGRIDGTLELYRNTAGPGLAPVFVIEPGFLDIDVGGTSVPYLVDLDDDGFPDLVMGFLDFQGA
ncbi:MAG TPA: VCBS repeat-containing protein, partial [bacterium]|nr:VCBS repeat-containing protein [bacterium]